MYGSSFMCVTRSPRASINAPIDADVSPLPIEETTPPVTSTNLVRRLTGGSPCRTFPYHALRAPASPRFIPARCLGNSAVKHAARVKLFAALQAQNVPTKPKPALPGPKSIGVACQLSACAFFGAGGCDDDVFRNKPS